MEYDRNGEFMYIELSKSVKEHLQCPKCGRGIFIFIGDTEDIEGIEDVQGNWDEKCPHCQKNLKIKLELTVV